MIPSRLGLILAVLIIFGSGCQHQLTNDREHSGSMLNEQSTSRRPFAERLIRHADNFYLVVDNGKGGDLASLPMRLEVDGTDRQGYLFLIRETDAKAIIGAMEHWDLLRDSWDPRTKLPPEPKPPFLMVEIGAGKAARFRSFEALDRLLIKRMVAIRSALTDNSDAAHAVEAVITEIEEHWRQRTYR